MKTAVMLVAHGTIDRLDDVAGFLQAVRHGREPPGELVQEIRRRYEEIGGASPLAEITRSVASKLEARIGLPVRVAMRFSKPDVGAVLGELGSQGVERAIVLPLAPYSTRAYTEAVEHDAAALRASKARVPELVHVGPWGSTPALLDAFARRIRDVMQPLPPGTRERTGLVITAHSVPVSIVAAGDPYERELLEAVEGIKKRVELVAWHVRHAYQSQGIGPGEDWLGPDLREVMLAAQGAAFVRLVVAPAGFVADHLEILYDLDIDARARAFGLGLHFDRTESLNDADDFVRVLEGLVRPHHP